MRDRNFREQTHPTEGEWRAYLDGEMPALARLRLRHHAAGCAPCGERLANAQAAGERTSRLLGVLSPTADVVDSWERLTVVMRRARRRPSAASAFMAGGLSAAVLAASVLVLHPAPTRLLGRLHGVGTFTNVVDACCSTSDAVTSPEGVFTLELPGMGTPLRVRYVDADGSGTFSTGDVVRAVSEIRQR